MQSLILLLSIAFAAEPPCYGTSGENVLEGEHFWIEWSDALGDAESSAEMLQAAEEARAYYIDEMGWPFTDRSILLRVQQAPSNGGVCQTALCDGEPVPVITLFARATGEPGRGTAKHEVAHAAQYSYMGEYLDAVASWPWWLEGCAVWMTAKAMDNPPTWARDVAHYLKVPYIALHQDATAYLEVDRTRTDHMYGTAVLAQYLEDIHGAAAVQATWQYGAEHTGEAIEFRDAIEAQGIDFEAFWRGYMAAITVVDVTLADSLSAGPFVEHKVTLFPDAGEPSEETRPQGYGLSLVKFPKNAGNEDYELEVEFEGDPTVPWLAVLVTTKGKAHGGSVQEIVPLEVAADGTGVARISGYDGSVDAWLVVSPQSVERLGYDYTWSAGFVAADTAGGKGKAKGCGCSTGGASGLWIGLLALVGLRRRG